MLSDSQQRIATPPRDQLLRKTPFSEARPLPSRNASSNTSNANTDEKRAAAVHQKAWPVLWLLEIFSALLSLACIAGLVAFLRAVDGKPYNSWHIAKVDITPNALLSLLSTICKACFLLCVTEGVSQLKWSHFARRQRQLIDLERFDSASRGQLGAAKLICSIHYRAVWACLGALITILAIATDPLTNQILTIRTTSTAMANATASIGHSFAYGLQANDSDSTEPQPLSDAMVRGIYAPTLQVNHTCPSGSCDWPSFDSLGFCSTCADLSDDVTAQCDCTGTFGNTSYPIYCNCNYTTPIFLTPTASFGLSSDLSQLLTAPDSLIDVEVNDLGWNIHNIAMDSHAQVAWLSAVRFEKTYPMPAGLMDGHTLSDNANSTLAVTIRPKVWNCTIGWCVKSFEQTTFSDGALYDQATSTHNVTIAAEYCYKPKGRLAHPICPVYAADGPTPPASALASPSNAPTAEAPQVYWINDIVTDAVQAYIVDTFNFASNQVFRDLPALTQTFYTANNGNISQTMQGMAGSMTNAIRQGPEAVNVAGTVYYPVAFVQVRWAWLVYLATLCFAAVMFLLAVIVISSRRRIPVWKSSSLALLYYGLSDGGVHETNANDVDAMKKVARDTRVQLAEGDGGYVGLLESRRVT